MPANLTAAECARAIGISTVTFLTLVRQGKITKSQTQFYDIDVVMAECKKNLSPDRPSKILNPIEYAARVKQPPFKRTPTGAIVKPSTPTEPTEQPPVNSDQPPPPASSPPPTQFISKPQSYSEIRTAREKVKLQADTMMLLELKQNKLVDTNYLRKALGDLVITLKTRLLGMASELAPEVAVISDASVCQDVIQRYVLEALTEISQWTPPEVISDEEVDQEIAS